MDYEMCDLIRPLTYESMVKANVNSSGTTKTVVLVLNLHMQGLFRLEN